MEHFLVQRKAKTMPRRTMRRPRLRRNLRSTISSAIAKKALRIAKDNKKFVNKTLANKQINYKQLPIQVSTSGFASGGFFGVTQGTSDGTISGSSAARVGNEVTLMRTQIKFNFDVASPQATSEQYNKIRLIVVQSNDGSQSIALSDVLLYNNYTVDGDLVFASPYTTKTNTNKRYNILLDKVFEVNYGHRGSKQINLVKKYGRTGKVVSFNGNSSSAPTDFKTTVLCITDSLASNHPTMSFATRHTFKDA